MSDKFYVGANAASLETGEAFDNITKVVINLDAENYVEYGTTTGRTLTIYCPWGTVQMAHDILDSLADATYQPYTAMGAIYDPSAEIGDGVTFTNVYGALWSATNHFGQLYNADISAPADEEIDHEYPIPEVTQREITRQLAQTKATLQIQSAQIAAKVESTGGDSSSFGWSLTPNGFYIYSDGSQVFSIDESGNANFAGEVSAKNIKSGGTHGTFSGSGITGGSIGTAQLGGGINTSLGYANFANNVFSGLSTAAYLPVETLKISGSTLWIAGTAYAYSRVLMNDTQGNPHLVLALT